MTDAELLTLIAGAHDSALLQHGLVTGLYAELLTESSAEEVARRHGWDSGRCAATLDAHVALGMLTRADGGYRVAPEAVSLVVKGRPGYAGDNVRHEWFQRPLWAELDTVLTSAEAQPDQQDRAMTGDAERMKTLQRTMRAHVDDLAPVIADLADWDDRHAVLDLGGGHGALLAAIAATRPTLHGVVVDQPHAREEAERTFQRAELTGQLSFRPRDISQPGALADLPADAVLISRVLHNFGADGIRQILRNARDALRPGGLLVVAECYLAEQDGRMTPSHNAVFSAYMAVACAQGHVPVTGWLAGEIAALGATVDVRPCGTYVILTGRW